MTERTFALTSTGPAMLDLELPIGAIEVQVLDSVTTASVVLRTEDESGPTADAVRDARSSEDGRTLRVTVPEIHGSVITQNAAGGVIHAGSGNVTSMVVVNGRVISGNVTTIPTVSGITARIVLPLGSSLSVFSKSADLHAVGYLNSLAFTSISGDARLDAVRDLYTSTTSGDVNVGSITTSAIVRSVSGDIDVLSYSGESADLTTTSGDVTVAATSTASGALRANTVSGDVNVRGGRHLDLHTRSVSGAVRTR
ncbi:hypothetical protein AN219_04590 [Streptomyces nanshensis]|nr:hypothetical protein AN219_04590 [Streptomyces nanshensis]